MHRRFVALALAGMLVLAGLAGCSSAGAGSGEGDATSEPVAVPAVEETESEGEATAEETESEGEATAEETESEAADSPSPDSPGAEGESLRDRMVADAEAEGRLVITGTLRIVNATELCELQEVPAEAAEGFGGDASRYALVVFDEPQMLVVMHSGDFGTPYEGEATMVAVAIDEDNEWGHEGDMSVWEPYDGQTVTVSIDPAETLFPSDVRLPMGQPHTATAEFLFAG